MKVSTAGRGTTVIGGNPFGWGRRTYVMGVINMTPDSFSGDGLDEDVDAAVGRALQFQDWGADIIDIGGESTRPGWAYEGRTRLRRDGALADHAGDRVSGYEAPGSPISVDTYKARVAEEALAAGASMVNDVWGFRRDPDMARVAADARVPVVLMHNQDHTRYDDLVPDVIGELRRMADNAVQRGVEPGNIVLEPGMGFGKTPQHNLEVLRRLDEFLTLGRPLLIGMSRKSTIGRVLGLSADERTEGTAATVALSIAKSADIVRVHDVKEMVRVARMSDAIVRGWEEG